MEKFNLMKDALEEIKKYQLKNKNNEGEFFQNYALYNTLYFLNSGDYNKAKDLDKEVRAGIKTYSKKINKSSLLTLCYNYSLVYFFNEDFDKTLEWLEQIEAIKTSVRRDLFAFAKILQLLCHFELKNYLLIESMVRSIRRNTDLDDIQQLVVSYLMKIAGNSTETKHLFETFNSDLDKLTKNGSKTTGISIYKIWIESYLKNTTIKTLYKISISS